MINFFKKENTKQIDNKIVLVCCLFIHAAKMDEKYTEKEKQIISKALQNLYSKNEKEIISIMEESEIKEKKANDFLNFTKEIKNYDKNFRLKIIEILWKIIYSDEISDMYESNLMRRLSALLYIDDKESGEIKKKITEKLKQ